MLKFLSSWLGAKSPAFIWVVTQLQGRAVGTDPFGNRYFEGAPRKGYKLKRRWVLYAGDPEPSSIPPEWHGWLHHQNADIPSSDLSHRKAWQRPHKPNLTGTPRAWRQPGHQLAQGRRPEATGDYQAWTPPQ